MVGITNRSVEPVPQRLQVVPLGGGPHFLGIELRELDCRRDHPELVQLRCLVAALQVQALSLFPVETQRDHGDTKASW